MTTALTCYFANAAAVTSGLTTANKLYSSSAGSPAVNQTVTVFGTATGYGEVLPRGGSAWAAGGSIPAASGNGFCLDSAQTNLSGQQIVAGNWSAEVRFCSMQSGSQAGTFTADVYVRAYKYSSGTYTNIVTMKFATQTINSTLTTYLINSGTATGYAGSAVNFSSGDVLYCDVILNITTNGNANVNEGVRINRLSTDTSTFVGDINGSVTTPGYQTSSTTTIETIVESATGSESVTETPLTFSSYTITESTTGTEIIALLNSYNLPVVESATGTESVTASNINSASPVENAPGSEIVLETPLTLATSLVAESATGSEIVALNAPYNLAIVESTTGSEIVTLLNSYNMAVVESTTGTEIVTLLNSYNQPIVETTTGTEVVVTSAFTLATSLIVESATGSEIVVSITGVQSPLNAQMQLADLAVQYSRIYASPTGAQLLFLATTYYGSTSASQSVYGELDAVMNYEPIAALHAMRTIGDVNAFLQSVEYRSVVLTDNPIVYYPLSESTGFSAYDISGSNFTGVMSGIMTMGQPGALVNAPDTAITFNGVSGCVTLPTAISTANWSALSLECWIQISNTTFTTVPRIVSNANVSSTLNGFDLALNAHGSGGYLKIGSGGSALSGTFSTVLSASTWYHLVATYDGSHIVIYINGAQVNSSSVSGSVITTAVQPVAIATLVGTANTFLPGTLQSVAIYNIALSASRVAVHYNAGINP